MKYLTLLLSLLLLLGFSTPAATESTAPESLSASAILEKTAAALNSLHTISYFHKRDYFTGEQHYITQGSKFIDFGSTDTIVGLKYQVRSGEETYIFNGSECFTLQQKEKTLKINSRPKSFNLVGGSFFYNSLVTLRRTLPSIAADPQISKAVKDTVVDGKRVYLVRFSLHKKTLDAFGGFHPITEDRTFSFQLFLNREDYFPVMLMQHNNVDEHSSVVTYSEMEPNASVEENSWYYSTYQPLFTQVLKKELALLPAGVMAPSFTLPLFDQNSTPVQSQQFRGKLLLLEFWIRNCGPCIASVPKLNDMAHLYKDRGLAVLAVNSTDTKPTLSYFMNRYKPAYPIAYDGGAVAEGFGVTAFPSVFILDKNGVIIYSGGFDEAAIKKALERAL